MKRAVVLFFSLIAFFVFGLWLVYLIPNQKLDTWQTKSVKQLETEDLYPNYFFNSDASIMDNFMDTLMIQTCRVSDAYDSALEGAMDNNGYPRYWNGYLLTLRPFLTLFSYQQIRYLNMFVFFGLLCWVFSGIARRCSRGEAFAFLISMVMLFPVLIPQSLQYFSVFAVTLGGMAVLTEKRLWGKGSLGCFFMALGMLTNFLDLLTAPLLSLGMPLVLVLLLDFHDAPRKSFREGFFEIVCLSAAWGLGYGLCWAAKWIIGTLILGKNVIADAAATAQFRTAGSEAYPLDRLAMLRSNMNAFFFAKGRRPAILLGGCIFLGWLIGMFFGRKKAVGGKCALLGVVALMPYVWYMVLANHSELHYFYTYRIQAITVFALLSAAALCLDPALLRKKFRVENAG